MLILKSRELFFIKTLVRVAILSQNLHQFACHNDSTKPLTRLAFQLQPIMLPHLLGVSVFFVSGFSYLLGNSVLTWVLVPRFHNVWVAYARIVITLVNLISCIPSILGFACSNALPAFTSSYADSP